MSKYDVTYNELVENILNNGAMDKVEKVRGKYKSDGEPAPAKSIANVQIKIDSSKEVPLLTTKRVAQKDPVVELLWIWQKMSNNVKELRDMGCTVWDEWERKDGTIGKSYGWQLKNKKRKIDIDELFLSMYRNGEFSVKPTEEYSDEYWEQRCEEIKQELIGKKLELNQVDFLLYQLKKNPYSRQLKTTLWCVEDLDDMALPPCVYETHFFMFDDKLNLTVNIRSNDIALGNPYNVYQYFVLHHMIAQVSNLEVGELCFNIDIPHIYNRHIEGLQTQIKGDIHDEPVFKLNKDIKSFYDFTKEDISIENYKHSGKFNYEVAI